jgi:ureidoacrylate peracid hydrolase
MKIKLPKDDWQIEPGRTAVLVIDIQRAYFDPGAPRPVAGGRAIVPGVNQLTAMCRRLHMPVIFICQTSRPDGSDDGLKRDFRPPGEHELRAVEGKIGVEFYPELDVAESDYVVPKIRYSAFVPGSSNLERLLRGLGRESIIACGAATDVCVATTIAHAMMLDFKVFLISDLTATFTEERQKAALNVIDQHFAKVMTFAELKKELKRWATRAAT